MPSLNLDLGYLGHPKTKRLVGLLGKDSELVPIRLWLYCGSYHAASGQLLGYSASELESAISWRGQAGAAVDALLRVGFLKEIEGGFEVHDWLEHSGHIAAFSERSKKANKARWDKARPKGDDPPTGTPKDAPRSPSGTPPPNLGDPLQGNAIPSEAAPPPKRVDGVTDSAWLERLWLNETTAKRGGCRRDAIGDAEPIMAELLRMGIPYMTVEAAIMSREDRTEQLWEFKKRLLDKKKSEVIPMDERVRRARAERQASA